MSNIFSYISMGLLAGILHMYPYEFTFFQVMD
jgi:hypothetical protein